MINDEFTELERELKEYNRELQLADFRHNCLGESYNLDQALACVKSIVENKQLRTKLRKTVREMNPDSKAIFYERKRMTNLLSHVLGIQFDYLIKDAEKESRNVWLEEIEHCGETITYQDLRNKISSCNNELEKKQITSKIVDFYEQKYNPAFWSYVQAVKQATRQIGEKSFLKQDFAETKKMYQFFLETYQGLKKVKEVALTLKDTDLTVFYETFRSLGLDFEKMANISIDLEKRKGKSNRAFIALVDVPYDLRLSVYPGDEQLESLLHEGGHAAHFSSVDPDFGYALSLNGTNDIIEAYEAVWQLTF